MVDEWGLDMVQLHGEESPVFCENISNHVKTIKAFRVNEQELISYKIEPYLNAVDYFLYDAMGEQYGGTGNQFNWDVIAEANISKPFFLSGGIGPNDAQGIEVLQKTKAGKSLTVIDINSQFEMAPGIKNLELIKTFINASI